VTLDEYKERLIADGITSVRKNETRQERIDGGIEGFALCRALNSPADFEEMLAALRTSIRPWCNSAHG
jgi:hypothetical protein